MTPYYEDEFCVLYQGDNRDLLPLLAENSFDSCVTDPPYFLKFMGKRWDDAGSFFERRPDRGVTFDKQAGNHNPSNPQDAARTRLAENRRAQAIHEGWTEQVYRVLKPGAFLLAFGGARTYHRMVCAIEDAGFIIHPLLAWIFGQGFPKATDLGKQIDKQAGADLAKQWDGYAYGLQALKPAIEPICMAQKPYEEKAVDSILKWSVGALNIDKSRIDTFQPGEYERLKARADTPRRDFTGESFHARAKNKVKMISTSMSSKGRWPANVIHDGSEEVLSLFPESTSGSGNKSPHKSQTSIFRGTGYSPNPSTGGDSGSAARFFYSTKADSADRGDRDIPEAPLFNLPKEEIRNTHPTVKPLDLLRYLLTLVTPPGGCVVDPFAGSGSTAVAVKKYGLPYYVTMIEREPEYCTAAVHRLHHTTPPKKIPSPMEVTP